MTLITLPYSPVDGDPEDISEIIANFTAILALINGGLQNDNCAADMALVASKIVLDTDGTLAANSDTKIPSQKAIKTYADLRMLLSYLDTDGTLAANLDTKVASQKAIKTYVDAAIFAPLGSMAWTPYTPATITGWATAGRTVDCSYLRIGTKTVFVNFFISGTSNATTGSFSAPALGNSSAKAIGAAGTGCDNTTTYLAIGIGIGPSNATINCGPISGADWTDSGGKFALGQLIYELA